MSKRFRFFIVLGLIILATFFLYPTFMWYVQLDSNKRELSASSNTQLRKYAEKKAYESLKELRELLLKPYSVTTLKNIHKLFIQLKEGKKLLYQYLKENKIYTKFRSYQLR